MGSLPDFPRGPACTPSRPSPAVSQPALAALSSGRATTVCCCVTGDSPSRRQQACFPSCPAGRSPRLVSGDTRPEASGPHDPSCRRDSSFRHLRRRTMECDGAGRCNGTGAQARRQRGGAGAGLDASSAARPGGLLNPRWRAKPCRRARCHCTDDDRAATDHAGRPGLEHP